MMKDMHALEGNAAVNSALQDTDDILDTNGLNCRNIGQPVPNNPVLTKPVHNVN